MSSERHAPVLFFSRGMGRGHAIPDAAIATELRRIDPSLQILFVSWSVGAATLRDLGERVVDLDLPESPSIWESVRASIPLFERYRPSFVISHEEFSCLPLARTFGLRSVFLIDWFIGPKTIQMQSLQYADKIIFLDEPGYYDEPPYLAGKVAYTGCVVRPIETVPEKTRARSMLNLPANAHVITVLPGGSAMHTEAQAPMFELVEGAFALLDASVKRLVWIAGDSDHLALSAKTNPEVLVRPPTNAALALIAASDLIITKGNRNTLFEASALGIPSISVSFGANPIDDYRALRINGNTALRAGGLTCRTLSTYMKASVGQRGSLTRSKPELLSRPRRRAAEEILATEVRDRLGN